LADGHVIVAPPLDVFEEGCEHFIGQKLPYPVVNSIANRLWGSYRLSIVLSLETGFFLFTFDSAEHAYF
jgi:hypothetical protein